MIFNAETSEPAASRKNRWIRYALIFALTAASTGSMMFCPCDSVGIHDYRAIRLVVLATFFGAVAAYLLYRGMRSDSGLTGFLRAIIAIAVIGASVFVELFLAMYVVAWLARPR